MPLIFLFDYTAQFIKLPKPVVIGLDNVFLKEKKWQKKWHVHTRVSKGQNILREVLGQKYFLVPLSLCPGTRAGAKIPRQTPLSWDIPGQNHFPKGNQKTGNLVIFF